MSAREPSERQRVAMLAQYRALSEHPNGSPRALKPGSREEQERKRLARELGICDACGRCPTCSPRPRGRPPVVAGEETTELRVRVGESHLRMLDELVRAGYAADRSAATRRAIEEAHRGRA